MSEKFKNKYTIKSARLQNYNYSQDGMYFVTICTKDKEEFFGEIKNGKMVLSDVGKIIQDEWLKTPIIRKNIILDEWIIMPNHLHGIIEIRNNENNNDLVETPRRGVSTVGDTVGDNKSMSGNKSKCGGYNPKWKPNSLGSIINQFKSVCTKRIWKSDGQTFAWQPRYYDHIIRDEISLNKIREYIINNPMMWERDKNNKENVWV